MKITPAVFQQLKADMKLYPTWERPEWLATTVRLLVEQGYVLNKTQQAFLDRNCCGAS